MYFMLQIIMAEMHITGVMAQSTHTGKNSHGMIRILRMPAVYTSMIKMDTLKVGILSCIGSNYILTIMNCSSLKTYGRCVPAITSTLSIMIG